MQFFIGREVKLKTTLGDDFEGEIFAIDVEHTSSVMLRDKHGRFHWIKTAIVRDIRPFHRSSDVSSSDAPVVSDHLPPLDWNAILLREQLADQRERASSTTRPI